MFWQNGGFLPETQRNFSRNSGFTGIPLKIDQKWQFTIFGNFLRHREGISSKMTIFVIFDEILDLIAD